jgi:hypothetical protein
MRVIGPTLLLTAAGLAWVGFATADQEASNVAHVTAGPYGRCYAKSVPSISMIRRTRRDRQGIRRSIASNLKMMFSWNASHGSARSYS